MPIDCLDQGCTAQLKTLRNSPVFAMSRGGKELFHTNFISFVLELSANQVPQDDWPKISGLQDRLKKLLFGKNPPARVVTWRERSSLDLIVMAAPTEAAAQGHLRSTAAFTSASGSEALRWWGLQPAAEPESTYVAVVVEAKLKALPTKEQLDRYNKKLTNTLTLEMESPVTVDGHGDKSDKDENDKKLWDRTKLRLLDKKDASGRTRFLVYDVQSEEPKDLDEVDPSEDPEAKVVLSGVHRGATRFAGLDASIRRVLLSPVSTQAVKAVVEETGWIHLPFKDLIDAFPCQRHGGELMVQLLADYALSTTALLHILDAASKAADCFCHDTRHTLDDLWMALKRPEFERLRIHDAVRKFAFDNLRRSLIEQCEKPADHLFADISLIDKSRSFKFCTDTFMSRAQPGINFEFMIVVETLSAKKKGRSVSIGVQLQGTIYRHFIRVSHLVDSDVTGLRGLARLLGDPTKSDGLSQRWWRADLGNGMMLNTATNSDFKPFGKEVFLYTDVNVATMTCQQLTSALRSSLAAARRQINDSMEFKEAVIDFLQGV